MDHTKKALTAALDKLKYLCRAGPARLKGFSQSCSAKSKGQPQKRQSQSSRPGWVWRQAAGLALALLIGVACGLLIAPYLQSVLEAGRSVNRLSLAVCFLMIGAVVAWLLQSIFHEAGHLVGGLLTGYRFSSFRIANFMWIWSDGRLQLKHFSMAGTGGQCIMRPPEWTEDGIPYILYNLGGPLANLILAVLFYGLFYLCRSVVFLAPFFLMLALMGLVLALFNGIPLYGLSEINNDGYNALSLGKGRNALWAFWVQMESNFMLAAGVRPKDMPEAWFELPSDEAMKNPMTSVLGVLACDRLMDQWRFDEADRLLEQLLALDSGIVGVHRKLMVCDRIYCNLIEVSEGKVPKVSVDELLDDQQKKFMKTMKRFPAVLRTQYALSLLRDKAPEQAKQIEVQFGKLEKTYPYSADFAAERGLMDLAKGHARTIGVE